MWTLEVTRPCWELLCGCLSIRISLLPFDFNPKEKIREAQMVNRPLIRFCYRGSWGPKSCWPDVLGLWQVLLWRFKKGLPFIVNTRRVAGEVRPASRKSQRGGVARGVARGVNLRKSSVFFFLCALKDTRVQSFQCWSSCVAALKGLESKYRELKMNILGSVYCNKCQFKMQCVTEPKLAEHNNEKMFNWYLISILPYKKVLNEVNKLLF